MSHTISYSTADKANVLAYLGSQGDLTVDQQRRLEWVRADAEAHQKELDRQGVDWGLTVSEALDHLLAGHTGSDSEAAGGAYVAALQHIIDHNGSDPLPLGTYARPSSFFGLVDEAMRRLGVPADLLPCGFLHGLPPEFPALPQPVDGSPAIGHLPLARAKSVTDAYRAVLGRMDEDCRDEVREVVEKLEVEYEEWERAGRGTPRCRPDTLFFQIL
ncbi:hypothetical protein [Streptomyces cacaoi]|uniref:DUF7691 family protein n=1 Tax=Streptomyces cacaoi TaxID=1898 RepID=UPI000A38BD00|nr:hypothetical protein [Streptomyces cacaoi]NNG86473.1 hypothetical protein [Streptomyces cacaoi]